MNAVQAENLARIDVRSDRPSPDPVVVDYVFAQFDAGFDFLVDVVGADANCAGVEWSGLDDIRR